MDVATKPLLDVARELGTFTKASLAKASGEGYNRVKHWTETQEVAGVLVRVGVGPQARILYRVAGPDDMGLQLRPRHETPHGNMWTAMRGMVSFSARDIAAHATTPQVEVNEIEAAEYCRALHRAGYLRAVHKAVPGRRPALYRLIRNTGPLPPRERRITGVWDDNQGRFAYLPDVAS